MGVGLYSDCSATAYSPNFVRVLFYWHASVYKKVAVEIVIWSLLYTLFSLIYHLALNVDQQNLFEKACLYCNKYAELLPVSFILGYYVTLVLSRWGRMWIGVGFVDSVTLSVGTHLKGESERAVTMRRQIVRYVLTFQLLVYRFISVVVKKKYPTLQSLVDAGYIEPEELEYYADNKFWMPIKWSMGLINTARREGMITNDFAVQQLFEYLTSYRRTVILLWLTDWVPVPLAYTQVVFVCVRLYFLALVLGRQFLNPEHTSAHSPIEIYVPILTLLQFTFFVGWSRLGESLLAPWGEDDDDFDTNFILGRNLKVGMDNVTNLKHKETVEDLEEAARMPRPEDIMAARNAVKKPRNSGHGSIPGDDGFTRKGVQSRPRAPTVMVKRSEVTTVEPTIENLRTVNTLRRRGNTVGTTELSRTIEYGIDEQTGLKTPLGEVRMRAGDPPRVFTHQHSCPSNMNTEREARLLSTLLEADELSLEHDDENSAPVSTLLQRSTALHSRDDERRRPPEHLITPSRQNSRTSETTTADARSTPDGGSSGSNSGVIVIRVDDNTDGSKNQQNAFKKHQ